MSSFQSFIARRYLVNTEPVLSGWITGVALVFLAVFATMVAAIAWYPATCMPLPGPTLPGWLWLGGSAALGLLPVLAIAAVLVFAKSRPHRIPGGLLAVMFLALLGALAASGIRASQSLGGHIDWPVPALALAVVAGLGAVLITIGSLAVVISGSRAYGHGWWHWVRVAISVAISPALILVIAVRVIIGQWWRGRVPGARGLLVIGAALWMLAMAPLAAVGARQAVGDVAGAALWGVIPLCAVALILAGIATWQRFGRLRPLRWHLGWAALALIVAAGILASAPWLVTAQRMWPMAHDLGIRTSPMALNIAAGAGIALAVLSGILALIRWRFTFFTTISIAGVALGSMALVIVLGVMTGFESDLREKILGSNAHILVTPKEGSFTEYRGAADIIADVPGVVAQTPFVSTEVVLATRQSYFTVVIKGVDPRTVDKVTELGQDVQEKGALERLWPLAPDGGPLIPADAGAAPATPPADAGITAPVDLSDAGAPSAAIDPAPPELSDIGMYEPLDLSGGGPTGAEAPGEPLDLSGDDSPGAEAPGEPLDAGGDELPELFPDLEGPEWEHEDGPGSSPTGEWDTEALPPLPLGAEVIAADSAIPPETMRLPGILVGRELLNHVPLYVGQEVRIISPLAEQSPMGPVPRTKLYRVAGIFYTGMYEYDLKFTYVTLPSLQSFLDLGDEVGGIEIRVEDPEDTEPVMAELRSRLGPGYKVADWKEINRSLFSALKLEKVAMFVILAIIILVAAFSIIGNLIMVVVEKAKEIATIKTLGASDRGVLQIFVVQGFFIGLVGTTIGTCLGLVACALGITYGLPLDPNVYYIDRLPVDVEPLMVLSVMVAGLVISVAATLYPAYMAARMRPVDGLRYE